MERAASGQDQEAGRKRQSPDRGRRGPGEDPWGAEAERRPGPWLAQRAGSRRLCPERGAEGGICLGVGIGCPLQRVPRGPWGPLVTSDPRPWTALGPREQLRAHQAPGYWDTPAKAGGPVFPGDNLEAFAVRTDTACLVALCKYCVFPKWKILW